jgi:hypothetical protein
LHDAAMVCFGQEALVKLILAGNAHGPFDADPDARLEHI